MTARQPIPEVSDEDVERIVRRDFAEPDQASVLALLNEYGSEEWHREIARVRVAILKLANGSSKGLVAAVKSASADYRDVLASAEFPSYMDHYHKDISEAEKREIIDSDWKQYQQWLRD